MISFWRIFWLELVSLVRSRTVATLAAVCAAWVLVFPMVVRGDGTASGVRELCIRYSLGGVFAVLSVSLLAAATGSIARERKARRLQLTMIRPIHLSVLALGKILAHGTVGALILAGACAYVGFRLGFSERCSHVLPPDLPPIAEEAEAMYAAALKDPTTPEEMRRAEKSRVLRLLTQRALDRYQTIQTNAVATWTFGGLEGIGSREGLAVRLRFTNPMELRQDVVGVFRLGACRGGVSNITQAVLEVPLAVVPADADGPDARTLTFVNRGKSAVMLRPRRDLELLVPADAFGWNLFRAYLTMVSVLLLLVSAGVLLSAAFGRPVALFVAFSVLIVGEMSPSVIEQYPDGMETNWADRMGLRLTRAAAQVTRPLSSLSPLESLAQGTCVERTDVLRALALDAVLLPLLFSLLVAFVLPRKTED